MNNRILRMKKIVCAAVVVLLMAGSAKAQLVFMEDFDGQSIFVSQANPLDFGGAASEVGVEQWFSASNGVAIANNGAAAGNDELQLTNFADGRARGAGIWLDSSAWDVGTATVEFDVLDYSAGGTGSESFFQAFFANGVDANNSVGIDVHSGPGNPTTTNSGTATIGTVGDQNTISGNATVSFTFNFTGQENIALVFHNTSGATGAQPVYSVDNLTVTISDATVLLGDANCDAAVDFLDIVPFIALLSNGDFKAQADVDMSGEVDFLDIVPFIAILSGS